MKTINATEAQKQFGSLIDAALHAPISITKHSREVVVLVSAQRFHQLVELAKTNLEPSANSPAPHALLGLLGAGKEVRAFNSPAEIDQWLQAEREQWSPAA